MSELQRYRLETLNPTERFCKDDDVKQLEREIEQLKGENIHLQCIITQCPNCSPLIGHAHYTCTDTTCTLTKCTKYKGVK